MDPINNQQSTFEHLVASCNRTLDAHEKYKDESSLRMAAFAGGRMVGFAMAFGRPPEWNKLIYELEDRARALGVA